MKALLTLALALAGAAHAETITFTDLPLYCGGGRYCAPVDNDTGAGVVLNAPLGGSFVSITVDGVEYKTQVGLGNTTVVTVNDYAYAPDGTYGVLSAQLHRETSTRRNRSGRGSVTISTWYLDSGSFVR